MFRLGTVAAKRGDNPAETRHTRMASKLIALQAMNARVGLQQFTPFKRDSARRIDRLIDYFGEARPSRLRHSRALFLVSRLQPSSRIERGVSVTVSLSARTR